MQQETVTIILPTYEEVESLPSLLEAIADVQTNALPNLQLIIVDDNSDDGTEALIKEMDLPWVQLIVRRHEKGLSTAVIRGLQVEQHETVRRSNE